MERRLLDYLPFILREYPQFQAMMDTQQPEFEMAWDSMATLRNDLFVLTASERGLSRWENLLGIIPKASDSMDTRRVRILAMLNRQLPYTISQLRRVLESLYGPGAAGAEISENSYLLRVSIPYTDTWADVVGLVDAMSPQNLLTRYTMCLQDMPVPAHVAVATGSVSMACRVRLPGVIGPKNVRAPAPAAVRLAHTYETINITIGGRI